MGTVSGVVEAKTGLGKFGTYGMLVDGKWYNSKYPIKAEKGDSVTFDDGGKNYIAKLVVDSKGEGGGTQPTPKSGGSKTYSRGKFPIERDDGQRSIVRQNSLTNAVVALAKSGMLDGLNHEDMVVNIINVAREFEAFSAGDLDREASRQLDEGFDPED